MSDKLLVNVNDACALLGGISRTTIYGLFKAGQLCPVKIGRRTYLRSEELRRYSASLVMANEAT